MKSEALRRVTPFYQVVKEYYGLSLEYAINAMVGFAEHYFFGPIIFVNIQLCKNKACQDLGYVTRGKEKRRRPAIKVVAMPSGTQMVD